MKKIILGIITTLLIISCSSDSSDNGSHGTIQWKFKANGVQYEWSGNYPYTATSGQASYLGETSSVPTINLGSPVVSSGNREIMLTFTFPNESTGNFTLDDCNPGNSANLVVGGASGTQYATCFGTGEIILNISQMATSTGGITKGTFSGTMVSVSQQLLPMEITEGSFEVIKIQ
jgi:hypothetical protein